MRRALTFVALASVLALAGQVAPPFARVGHACLCGDDPPVAQALQEADAVFAGRVYAVAGGVKRAPGFLQWLSVQLTGQALPGRIEPVHARLTIIETWKGALGSDVEIWTGMGSGDCGYPFHVREEHLIYAHYGRGGTLGTSICTRSRPLSRVAGDLAALGPGTRPTLDSSSWLVVAESSLRAVLPNASLLSVLLGLVTAGVLTWASIGVFRVVRKRRRSPSV